MPNVVLRDASASNKGEEGVVQSRQPFFGTKTFQNAMELLMIKRDAHI